MFLQELKLKNIRSYREECITFSPGSTLLSGDIGSGKSSLLLAIEFALFGTSRPDLPAENLLRKGSTEASAELTFSLKELKITIQRNLKKDKNGIKQTPGYIIINSVKKELTAVELKAEIFSLLAYPEDTLSKNKNYLFRYTLYCPQEEMKFILLEDPEIRLDTLRKIFNIDKYKNIRENLQVYMKTMRTRIAILKAKTEPLEELEHRLKAITEEGLHLHRTLELLEPEVAQITAKESQIQEALQGFEKEQQQQREIREKIGNISTLLKEKEGQKKLLIGRQEQTQQKMADFSQQLHLPSGLRKELLPPEIARLKREKEDLLTKKTECTEKIRYLQKTMKEVQEEIEIMTLIVKPEQEKLQQLLLLEAELQQKESISEKRKQLEELLQKASEMITKNETLLAESKRRQQQISRLDECPMCFQHVPSNHKQAIHQHEAENISRAEQLLAGAREQRGQIIQQKQDAEKMIQGLQEKEKKEALLRLDIRQIAEKKQKLEEKKEKLHALVIENNLLMIQLQGISDAHLQNLQSQLDNLQKAQQTIILQENLSQQLQEFKKQQAILEEDCRRCQEELQILQNKISEKTDLSGQITLKKAELGELLKKGRELLIQQTQMMTKIETIKIQKGQQEKDLTLIRGEKNKFLRYKEIHYWLEEYFLKLTHTIEKHVLANIHAHFNELFQEWFSLLVKDDHMMSRIDDSFTPIIEQNGHELDFSNLSGGERTSAALAYRLALNKVINDVIHEIRTKDLLILDEPTDGFSADQLDNVRDVLERLGLQQVIIVSHESKIESFVQNVIRIEKIDHVSQAVR